MNSSALYRALALGDEAGAEMLMRKGADLSWRNHRGQNVLHKAAEFGSARIAKLALKAGIEVDEPDAEGFTALHLAADRRHLSVAQLLLDHGASVNAETAERHVTPLYYAVRDSNHQMVSLFLRHGARMHQCYPGIESPFAVGLRNQRIKLDLKLLNILLEHDHDGGETIVNLPRLLIFTRSNLQLDGTQLGKRVLRHLAWRSVKLEETIIEYQHLISPFQKTFLGLCLKELRAMEDQQLLDGVSLYTLLTSSTKDLLCCPNYHLFSTVFYSISYETTFPIYASTLKDKMDRITRMSIEY